jgi:hypothetical protein
LPEKIEQIKKLRKYEPVLFRDDNISASDFFAETMDQRSSGRSPWTRSTVVRVGSSHLSGKDPFLILRRVSDSEERQFQNAKSFSRRLREERSPYLKVFSGFF